MAGLLRIADIIFLFALVLRLSVAQDTCGANDHFALFVHNNDADTDGVYKALANFDAGNDFTKLPLMTTENPTAVFKDVVNDLVYWAGNDLTIGRYIKRDTKAGTTTQDTSLISCSGSSLGVGDSTITDPQLRVGLRGGLVNMNFLTEGAMTAMANRARLDQIATGNLLGAWIAADATDPWIEVYLLGRPTITGIILQGRSDADMWTTTFKVQYSQDGVDYTSEVKDASGNTDVFIGNIDRNSKVTHIFHQPVVALYVRIVPLTWYYDPTDTDDTTINAPALRFELLGCKVPQCTESALGVEDGTILDSQLSEVSGSTVTDGRLHGPASWVAANGAVAGTEYVEVFFDGRVTVTGVITQGRSGGTDWVTQFEVQYRLDGGTLNTIQNAAGNAAEKFTGNTDEDTPVPNNFPEAVSATHIRIYPTMTNNGGDAEMRFEVLGCREPEITRLAVDGTCGSQKIYWIERGQGSIYYSDLESDLPTANELVTGMTEIVDIELDRLNDHIYFAQQSGTTSYIKSARLSDGAIQNTVAVSNTNGGIQSISIDWDTNRVYYSINADFNDDGIIGYVNLALDASSNTVIYTPDPVVLDFFPFDIAVYDMYVYALKDRDSIVRVMKSPADPATNTLSTVVAKSDVDFPRLAADFSFVKCIDFPTVTINQATYSVEERDGTLYVDLKREGDLRCCSTVDMTLDEDMPPALLAKLPEDFTMLPNSQVDGTTVTFNAGADNVRLEFLIIHDNNVEDLIGEGVEIFKLTLAEGTCSTLGNASSTEVSIRDYYSCYYLDPIDDVVEGDSDTTESFLVRRKGYVTLPGAINVELDDGTAIFSSDYRSSSSSVSFGTGGSMQQAQVVIVGDSVLETSEDFQIRLGVPFNADYTLLCPEEERQASITITDNDFLVYLKETHVSTREGLTSVNVPVCRQGYTGDGNVNVPISLYDDSAKAGSDYIRPNQNIEVSFPSGEKCVDATINLINDEEGEPIEAFRVVISNPSKGELGENRQTYVGIIDDDLIIKFDKEEYEINEATGELFVQLLRDDDLNGDEDVYLVAVSGSALSGQDFTNPGQISFPAGDLSKTVKIDILDDEEIENAETFTLRLQNAAGEILSMATVTIEDDDVPVSITPNMYFFDRSSLDVDENDDRINVVVIRTRTEEAGFVTVTTSSGSATSGVDFLALTSSQQSQSVANFQVGDARATVTIQINNDNDAEEDESFTASLSAPSDGTASNNIVVITILDDDGDDDDDDDVDGGDGNGDNFTISSGALIGIILGASLLTLTLLALAVCGCCLLLRSPPTPNPQPPAPQPYAPPPARYGQPPAYGPGPQSYNRYYGQARRGLGPV